MSHRSESNNQAESSRRLFKSLVTMGSVVTACYVSVGLAQVITGQIIHLDSLRGWWVLVTCGYLVNFAISANVPILYSMRWVLLLLLRGLSITLTPPALSTEASSTC